MLVDESSYYDLKEKLQMCTRARPRSSDKLRLIRPGRVQSLIACVTGRHSLGANRFDPEGLAGASRSARVRVRALRWLIGVQRSLAVRLDRRTVGLERTLAMRTAERGGALPREAKPLARRGAAPSAFERAVEQVRREVAYSRLVLRWIEAAPSREALIAHATMSYVVGHVSAPDYGYMNVLVGTQPTPTPNGVLEAGSGICGHAALTFAAIVKRFGLPVRRVLLWYENGAGHTAAEVFYDGAWHYSIPRSAPTTCTETVSFRSTKPVLIRRGARCYITIRRSSGTTSRCWPASTPSRRTERSHTGGGGHSALRQLTAWTTHAAWRIARWP